MRKRLDEPKRSNMKIEIKSWRDGRVIFAGEFESLLLAVEEAVRKKIDLRSADLRSADLRSADLCSANLSSAKGLDRNLVQPLMMLLDQPGQIRAYKLTTKDLRSPIAPGQGHNTITYEIGSDVSVDSADENPDESCGAGIHVGTLAWCLSNRQEGNKILIVEFSASDIACIPYDTSGKFRVRKLRVIGEKEVQP
jgi:hypothetical protein